MREISAFGLIKELETSMNAKISSVDLFELPTEERDLIKALQRQLVDARLDIRDYDLSDTRAEQIENAALGRKRLEGLRALLLDASHLAIFSSVDIAHFSAHIEHISEQLT